MKFGVVLLDFMYLIEVSSKDILERGEVGNLFK